MANLIVRNIDEDIAQALKVRASQHGISPEAEHRRILEQVLTLPKKKSFIEVLSQIPNVGKDSDFERIQAEQGNAVNPQTMQVLITSEKEDIVQIIDLVTDTLIQEVSVGKSPHAIAVDPVLNKIITADKKSDTVTIIDIVTGAIIKTPVGRNPLDVAANPETHIAAVTNNKDDTVTIIDINTGTIKATVPIDRHGEELVEKENIELSSL